MKQGFSILEMMVAMILTLTVVAMMAGNLNFQKRTFTEGAIRSRISQGLRGTLDIIGTDLRIGGENLPMTFPSFLITDGGVGSDTISVRRALLEDALPLCGSIAAGSIGTNIVVADDAVATPGCGYTGIKTVYNRWVTYRTGQTELVRAFIYNLSTREGEFFTYESEVDGTTNLIVRRPSGSGGFLYTYPAGGTAIYILEEWQYRLTADQLEVVQNGDTANPLSVMFGVESFRVNAVLQDNTVKTSFTGTDAWTQIKYIEVTLAGEESKPGGSIEKEVTSRFFPRNILSF